jgi:hypothetical protein
MVPKSGPKKLHASAAFRHKWLRMDEEGDTQEVALGKHALMHRLGVQARSSHSSRHSAKNVCLH